MRADPSTHICDHDCPPVGVAGAVPTGRPMPADIARPKVIGRHIYGHLSQTGDLNCVCGWTSHPTRNREAAYATWEAHATAPDPENCVACRMALDPGEGHIVGYGGRVVGSGHERRSAREGAAVCDECWEPDPPAAPIETPTGRMRQAPEHFYTAAAQAWASVQGDQIDAMDDQLRAAVGAVLDLVDEPPAPRVVDVDSLAVEVPDAAVLAVIEVMGWPDDRGAPWEPNVPAQAHWELATQLVGAVLDETFSQRWIDQQMAETGIRSADFRNGVKMDLDVARDLTAHFVAAARAMLGDATNYTETKLEFDVKVAESPEMYTMVVQRHGPGVLTPHEARQKAESERDAARAEVAAIRALHVKERGDLHDEYVDRCAHCTEICAGTILWPCPTIRTLNGDTDG